MLLKLLSPTDPIKLDMHKNAHKKSWTPAQSIVSPRQLCEGIYLECGEFKNITGTHHLTRQKYVGNSLHLMGGELGHHTSPTTLTQSRVSPHHSFITPSPLLTPLSSEHSDADISRKVGMRRAQLC